VSDPKFEFDNSKQMHFDEFVKSRHSRENGNPEEFELVKETGFLPEFTPYVIRGRNDGKEPFQAFLHMDGFTIKMRNGG
jgi:hypothetical protein